MDYYQFTLGQKDRISISLTQPGEGGVYYEAVLYDQDHNVIGKSQMNADQSLIQTLDKGTYYIRIAALNGEFSRNPYVLTLDCVTPTTPAKNPTGKPTATVSAAKKPARPTTSAAASKKKSDAAKTADNTPLEQWMILTVAGAGVIVAALARKRMRK